MSVYISYSSYTRYKECSEKYFLAKEYESIFIPAQFPYGNAVEDSVEAMLLGKTLEEAISIFETHWLMEPQKDGSLRMVLGNPLMQFLPGDYDPFLITGLEAKYELHEGWQKEYEDIAERIKDKKPVNQNEQLFYNKIIWICCLVRAKILLKVFHDELLPDIEIYKRGDKIYVQTEIKIENEEGDKIIGFADFVVWHKKLKKLIILDLKTSKNAYEIQQLIDSDQLKTYVAALNSDLDTISAGYVVLIKKLKKIKKCEICSEPPSSLMSKKCKKCGKGSFIVSELKGSVQFIHQEFPLEQLEEKLIDYAVTVQDIKANKREKNQEACYSYGRKCEFYDHCWNGKPLDQIEDLKPKISLTKSTASDKVKE